MRIFQDFQWYQKEVLSLCLVIFQVLSTGMYHHTSDPFHLIGSTFDVPGLQEDIILLTVNSRELAAQELCIQDSLDHGGSTIKKEYLQGESSEWDEACDIGEFNGRYIPNKVQEAGGGNNDIFNPELSKFRYLKLYSGLENGVKIFGYQITW